MTLNITIAESTERKLRESAAACGQDLSTYLSRLVDRWAEEKRDVAAPASPLPSAADDQDDEPMPSIFTMSPEERAAMTQRARAELEELIKQQGVRPFTGPAPDATDRWPEGETVEDFLQTIYEQRKAGTPRVRL